MYDAPICASAYGMHILSNFKNFENAGVDLFEPLTILLGRNGSGKTNLIEGVELFAALASGASVNDITDVGREGTFKIRGGLESCVRYRARRFQLQLTEATVPFGGSLCPVDYTIEVALSAAAGAYVAAEKLMIGRQVFFDAKSKGGDVLDIRYDNFTPGRKPTCPLSTSSSVLSRYDDVVANAKSPNRMQEAKATVRSVKEYLRRSYTFDPLPMSMRNYERVNPKPLLSRNGSNLSAVLFALSKGTRGQRTTLKRITETIRQIPEEPFEGIGFVETSLGDVMAGFRAKSTGGSLIDARVLSDGTLRMLAVLVALETTPEHSRIVIEEFDAGLHPTRAELLARHLAEAADRNKLNIVLTTHNTAFMNALNEAQMESVWICHRNGPKNGSTVTRLGDLDSLVPTGLTGGLGQYVAGGALEKRLAPSYGDDRRRAMKQWIESVS